MKRVLCSRPGGVNRVCDTRGPSGVANTDPELWPGCDRSAPGTGLRTPQGVSIATLRMKLTIYEGAILFLLIMLFRIIKMLTTG